MVTKKIIPKKKTAVIVKKNGTPQKSAKKEEPAPAAAKGKKTEEPLPMQDASLSAEQQLLNVTEEKPKGKKEDFDAYAQRLATAIDALPEKVWDTLGEAAQKWYTDTVGALNNDKSPPAFPEKADEDPPATGAEAGDAEDEYDADDLAVLTLVCADLEADAEAIAKKAKKKVPEAEEDRVLDLHQIAHTTIHVLEELGWTPPANE